MTISADNPTQGPDPSGFSLYIVPREPSLADISTQPYEIGISCMPLPLSKGNIKPPPFCLVNSIGYNSSLGYPIRFWIGPAPCTVISIPYGFPVGTYTLQGYIIDNGSSSSSGISTTNAIVVKVQ